MPIFASKLYDRENLKLKRALSIDRLRLDRNCGVHWNNTLPPNIEFGVVKGGDMNAKNIAFSSSLPTAGILSSADPLLVPPAEFLRSSSHHSFSSISASISPSSSVRAPSITSNITRSSGTTRRTSRSPIPLSRTTLEQESGLSSRGDSEAGHSSLSQAESQDHISFSASKKRDKLMSNTRSSPDLKERPSSKPRPKSPLPPQRLIQDKKTDGALNPFPSDTQMRPSRGMRQPSSSQSPSTQPSPMKTSPSLSASESRRVKGLAIPPIPCKPNAASPEALATTPALSSASSPLSPFSCQKSSPAFPSTPIPRRDRDHAFNFSRGYKSSGSISDSSYGSPLSDIGISIKNLLSKPASMSNAPLSAVVRSEPEMDSSFNLLTTHKPRMEPTTPTNLRSSSTHKRPIDTNVLSQSNSFLDADPMGRLHTSDPRAPQRSLGSGGGTGTSITGLDQGRSTLERSGALDQGSASASEREVLHGSSLLSRTGECPHHIRQHSSAVSLSSPSEGGMAGAGVSAGLFRYGTMLSLAGHGSCRDRERGYEREREHERGRLLSADSSMGQRPHLLSVSEMRRLSSLGARAADAAVALSPLGRKASGNSTADGNMARPRSTRPALEEPARSTAAREASPASHRTDSPPPPGLTPAEFIAHAYKQQEKRRAELVLALSRDHEQPEKPEILQRDNCKYKEWDRDREQKRFKKLTAHSTDYSAQDRGLKEKASAPYYTVLGDRDERIAIGNARDSAYGLFEEDKKLAETERALVAELAQAPHQKGPEEKQRPRTLRRKLSRKMSGKFKKESGKEGGNRERDEQHEHKSIEGIYSHVVTQTKSASSEVQHSATLPRDKIIQMMRRNSLKGSNVESESGKVQSLTRNDVPVNGRDERDRSASEPIVKLKSGSGGAEKRHGHSLWGLVRKISHSALKDKYKSASTAEPLPPVPSLPADLPDRIAGMDVCIALPQFSKVKPSRSHRPSTAPTQNTDLPVPFGRFRIRQPSSQTQQFPVKNERYTRLGHGTRSSSPVSSGLTSNDSHKRGQSSQSSWSSYDNSGTGITTPDAHMLNPLIGQHILPPEKLFMLETLDLGFSSPCFRTRDDLMNKKPQNTNANMTTIFTHSNDRLLFGEEIANHQALPAPPRRSSQHTTKLDEKFQMQTEPPIMVYTNDHAAHSTFGLQTHSLPATIDSGRASPVFTAIDYDTSKKASNTKSFKSAEAESPLSTCPLPAKPEPPSRPPRSARRIASATAVAAVSIHASQSSMPAVRGERDVFASRNSNGTASQSSTPTPRASMAFEAQKLNQNSHQNQQQHATTTTITTPPLVSAPPSTISSTTTITGSFRGIGDIGSKSDNGGRIAWTEKEKQAMWDDLISRSERAGGTLHVGFGGLLSDSLRDSVYSVQTTQTDSVCTE